MSKNFILNAEKSNVIFHKHGKKLPHVPLVISNTKFLGVILDNNLTWKQYLQYITNKILSLSIITRSKLTLESLKSIYHSLIHPHITYCSLISGGVPTDKLKPLNKAQKRVIRTIIQAFQHSSDQNQQRTVSKKLSVTKC